MIILKDEYLKDFHRQSSKGNQLKWEKNGVWYKGDYTGYEGMSEFMISRLLQKSSLDGREFVLYNTEEIQYKNKRITGCRSNDFLDEGWQIITLERLFMQRYGTSLYQSVYRISEAEKRLKFLVDQVIQMTGLDEFGIYMNKLMTIDAFFLNEDRHMHNIAVLMNQEGQFRYCPIFDQGAGLLSDTRLDYPLEGNIYELVESVQSKTFSYDFDEQLDVSEKLFGHNLIFYFGKKDVEKIILEDAFYPEYVHRRVENLIKEQMRKYQYLFQ